MPKTGKRVGDIKNKGDMKRILIALLFFTAGIVNAQEKSYVNNYFVGKTSNAFIQVHMYIASADKVYIWESGTPQLDSTKNSILIVSFTPNTVQHSIFKLDSVSNQSQVNNIYDDLNRFYIKYINLPGISRIKVYPDTSKNIASYGDRLEVHVKNANALFKASQNKGNPIVLYIDNYPLTTIIGRIVDDSIVNFTLDSSLDATEQDKDFWTTEYHASASDANKPKGILGISLRIGTKDGAITSKPYTGIKISIYNPTIRTFTVLFFILLTLLLIWLGLKTDILRENCECNCTDKNKNAKKPFSLSRSQMAFWTVIVAFSFAYIYLITGEMPDITNGTLILLGISSTTTLGGSLMDTNDVTARSQNAPADRCCSEGFLKDILSDGGMLGIHRMQNVLFTLILGLTYISKVVVDLEMQDFNTNLLLLMGISSGTYLGVKYFANQTLAKNGAQQAQQAAQQQQPAQALVAQQQQPAQQQAPQPNI